MEIIKRNNTLMLAITFMIVLGISACEKKAVNSSDGIKPLTDAVPNLKVNATVTITANMGASGGPDVTYLRGMAAGGNGGFTDLVPGNRLSIDVDTAVGMKIVNGIRNIYKETGLGEFYKDAGGVYRNQQSTTYTGLLNYVHGIITDPAKKLIQLNQIGGTPDNTASPLYALATQYTDPDEDYVPLPTIGTSMTAFQNNFIAWAKGADSAVGSGYHAIWIAHQEPAHTLGYINGIETDAAKELNIRRFIDYWKPIAAGLRTTGAKVGGIQNNSANANHFYTYSVNYLKQQNVQLDYLTFQFYQWGDRADLDSAIASLNNYNLKYPGTKMIVNRGMWLSCCATKDEAVSTSKGLIYYLRGERNYMDYADKIYAHIYDDNHTDLALMEFKVATWLNNVMSTLRRPLTGLPAGVDGFLTGGVNKATAALWNTSATTQTLNLQLNNTSFTTSKTLTVHKGSGSSYLTLTGAGAPVWNNTTKTISPITLATNEFVLITLQ
ncbi:hypothetical protein [Mucilaginibacter boryungensis]|uniref:Uncharacterized protein n=1 Tax=Mucilaginibacter boryungensis TaxID=768480 RepID=A0ABR9XJD4_9SPHI|nr:hypothetical protein [Mucilaginibacter boryungensis]MBE9667150.1 hypothetical protein [Mucilaginibacter boryungensis]